MKVGPLEYVRSTVWISWLPSGNLAEGRVFFYLISENILKIEDGVQGS